jgi:hypothetical protein
MKYRINKSITFFYDSDGYFNKTFYVDDIIDVKLRGEVPIVYKKILLVGIRDTYIICRNLDTNSTLNLLLDDIIGINKISK